MPNHISECNELPNNIVKQLFSSLWFSQEIDQRGRAWSFVVVRLRDRPERASEASSTRTRHFWRTAIRVLSLATKPPCLFGGKWPCLWR